MAASATYKRVEVPEQIGNVRKQAMGMLGSTPDQSAYNYGASPDLRGSDAAGLRARSNIMRQYDSSERQRLGAGLAMQAEDWQMRNSALNENLRRRAAMQSFLNQEGEKAQAAQFVGTGLSTVGQAVPGPIGAVFQAGGAGASAYGQYLDPERRLREGGY